MSRAGQFAKTLEPGLAVADCCGAVVCLDGPGQRFRHPLTCEDCWIKDQATADYEAGCQMVREAMDRGFGPRITEVEGGKSG